MSKRSFVSVNEFSMNKPKPAFRGYFIPFCIGIIISSSCFAQKSTADSSLYYDDLISELESFLDSLTKPRTTLLLNMEVGNNYVNYATSSTSTLAAQKKFALIPAIGYFHKSGFGVSGSASIIKEEGEFNPFQFSLSGSYDYLRSQTIGTGVSVTHYFTKDSLNFYTSPLENEAMLYITYKGGWLRPILSAAYGWGSRKNVEERKGYINVLRGRRQGVTQIATEENISDFSLAASVKHDFYWLDKLGPGTVLRFTPQITFTTGTQNFGFNQISTTYLFKNNRSNILANSKSVYLDDELTFQPLSLCTILRGEVSFEKFFIQPQVIVDYYFPAERNNLTAIFRLNIGVSL